MTLLRRSSDVKSILEMAKTAGIIIIGDEILKGHTQDTNSFFLSKLLHSSGLVVKRTTIIGDDINEIAHEMREFAEKYDYVFTSGGIGPTHDDKTFDASAVAFNEKLCPNETMVGLCKKYFGDGPMDSPKMKMALIPESAVLHFGVDPNSGESYKYPLVAIRNMFMFPGIPTLLEKQAKSLIHLFESKDEFAVERLLIKEGEIAIADVLRSCQDKFSASGVSVGSYPDIKNNYYKVRVIIESNHPDASEAAKEYIVNSLPQKAVVKHYVESPVILQGDDVYHCPRFPTNLRNKIDKSIDIIKESLRRYQMHQLCVAFNGGKDCTALLHLVYAVLCMELKESPNSITCLYIKYANPFEEIESFMENSVTTYRLDLIAVEGKVKEALKTLKSDRPQIEGIFMGTRSTDPYSSNLESFSPTDSGWPDYMRINPLLEWTYHDVWEFVRILSLPYCMLYDFGYTSLGGKENTKKNDQLKYINENNVVSYRPAYTLQDEKFERIGRL